MKTIKIIDLYHKIVMNEELPKKVKYKNKIYILDNKIEKNPYVYKENGNWKTYLIGTTLYDCPTDEVEIIEENKKIEKLEIHIISQNYMIENENAPMEEKMKLVRKLIYDNSIEINIVKDKINELIDEVNKLKGKYE